MRINISLPDDILAIIDKHCKEKGYTRSEYIRFLVRQKAEYLAEEPEMSPVPLGREVTRKSTGDLDLSKEYNPVK